MEQSLKGKTALVTAAANGIGRASAEALAQRGAHVIATDIDGDGVASLADTSDMITAHRLDVLDADAVASLISDVPTPGILVNCAGWVHDGTILDCDDAVWDRSFDLNAKAMFRLTKAVLPGMLDKGAGSIINIAYSTEPQSLASIRSAERAQYVLELNAVVAEAYSIEPGSRVLWGPIYEVE